MQYFKKLKSQLLLLIFLFSIDIMARMGFIPTPIEAANFLKTLFEKYGLFAIAFVSFAENIVGINAYFPGSLVLLVAMSLTSGNLKMAIWTFFAIYLPSILAHHINYFIGLIDKNKLVTATFDNRNLKKCTNINTFFNFKLTSFYFTTFWHPHFTALSCLASGKENIAYRFFIINLLAVGFIWNIFWAVIMYNMGNIACTHSNLLPLMYCYLIIWIILDIYKEGK